MTKDDGKPKSDSLINPVVRRTEEARHDIRPLNNGEWDKKSRDDVIPATDDRPIPENPLLKLKPPSSNGNSDKASKDKLEN